MPFPRRLLNEGEEITLDLRPHWWYFANHIFTGVPLLVALLLPARLSPAGQVGR